MTEPSRGAGDSAWTRLRDRKVVQWGLGYVAVAWGLLQGLEFAVATFRWPEVLTRVGAVVAALGVPLTVTLDPGVTGIAGAPPGEWLVV